VKVLTLQVKTTLPIELPSTWVFEKTARRARDATNAYSYTYVVKIDVQLAAELVEFLADVQEDMVGFRYDPLEDPYTMYVVLQ